MNNKKKTLCQHTKKRLAQRFGLHFNDEKIREMALICRAGHYVCALEKQSLTRTKAVIYYKETLFPVIYDKKRKCIITVLEMEMLSQEERNRVEDAYKEFLAQREMKS